MKVEELEFLTDLQSRFPAAWESFEEHVPNQLLVRVSRDLLPSVVEHAVREMGARFVISIATDMSEKTNDYRVSYVLALDRQKKFLILESSLPADDLKVRSITPKVPAANWSEREAQDLLGVAPIGHPDQRRLILPDDFPNEVHPLRREFAYNERFPSQPQNAPARIEAPEGTTVIPLGPFYPVLEEPAYFRLFLDGERVVGSDYRGFYNHRAVEKLGDSELNYNQVPFVAQQICGICGQVHSCAYCQAVEDACGIDTPLRAKYIRSLLLELERIHSHLLWVGLAGHILGFDTVLMQLWRIREPVMWLMERITGNRKHYSSNLIGGVRFDIDQGGAEDIRRVLDKVESEFKAVVDAIAVDTTLMARLKGVGILTEEEARVYATVGPVARGSNVPIDVRVDHPYAAYGELGVRIQVQEGCDSWARTMVRVLEIFESIRLVRKALADMPGGPLMAKIDQELPSGKIGLCSVEAARGEAHHYVLTGEENRPYRWRVRAPTYQNLQAVGCMIQGENLADVPISLGSYDPCFSCTERVETVDLNGRQIRIWTREELQEMSRRKSRQKE
jgi:Ni,Fe-hydrogenase III large subunit/Ni,Fe-hydrogenase III component G